MQTKETYKIIDNIVDRAIKDNDIIKDRLSLFMDIDFTHRETPLKLQKFLEADDLNFFHDIYGILQNFNRQTKKMENCFLPRFTK